MDIDAHLDGLREALDRFATCIESADWDAPVPTAPGWDVRHLVAHQGMVHRWATATIEGREVDPEVFEEEGLVARDLLQWLSEGAEPLVEALLSAPDDLDVPVFLHDAPPARAFWARRQCHETTIHAVDALGAALGRRPHAEDTWIGNDLALDGIDELLTGFLPRRKSRLRTPSPMSFAVLPDGAEERWLVTTGEEPPVTTRGAGDASADVVLRGTPVALYLAVWNRSDEVSAPGFELWSEHAKVVWS
ncbi:maleylpyruvate isomerase family mycothiol-dependent enzyme [Nocardioides euryhalodurans]|uniref:Maleylpyruvate isomerase family mycothiol-dependent enzyme n=1 Tax=Nocardioides euryhalodurans TaxID=2518370 RepID=A0A4P7GGS7_9ACTN|nr:maleylpyruvate isomerase family mycothiol-dependent enzyme [Nocardioides euryhalodurans]QBR91070.1 maleylpyruvate isomerase family mycothiol-dependent enzyme [Nocardioides euryhalodurans]